MRPLRTSAFAVLAVMLTAGACAPATSAGTGELIPGELYPTRESPVVRVTNNNWSTMTLYAVRGTSRFRLGMVNSMGSAVFRLPPSLAAGASGLRLLADPLGGSGSYLTPALQVNPGEEVRLDLQNHLPISSYSIFARR
ncbi:MAG TPA: hypothetical protein VHG51_15210 [Longimicrobiaceae bacterium]|nr:hypothetical protein [Longimicrobiaceae bacterium]